MGLKSVVTGIVNPYQVAEKSCSPVVLEERRIRCACPSVQVFKKCIKHNFLAVQRIHYKLDRKLNNCKMYKTKELKKLTCSKPQLIQTPCGSKLENYEQSEVTKLWYADQCKCLLKVIKKKWVCNCQARYPKQVIKKCLPNGNQILTLTTIWHNEGRKCVNRTEKQLDDIKCPMNLKIVKGKCDRSKTGRLPLTYLQQRPKHCQCVWQRLKDVEVKNLKLKSSEACRCHRNFMVKRCQSADGNKPAYLVRMYFKYLIQQGECHIYRKTEKKPVVCKLGSQIKKSKCNPITNEHVESRIDTYLDGCQCHRKLVKRRCQCNCPKPKNNSVCQSRDGLLRRIKVVHEFGEDQCTCKAKYYVQSSRVQCNEPPKLIKIGKCHKLPQNESEYMQKNDLYRNVFWSQLHRVGCQCQHKRYMEQIPCYCSPDVKEEKYCIADKIIEIRKTERKLSEDKKRCIRVVISKVRHPIYLEKPIYDKRCNLKTGIETIIQKLPLVENCKRRYRVNVRHRKCKCKTQPRLIRQSNCSPSCKVQYMWIMERSTSDGKCKYYYRVRQRDCCCPPETNLGTFCNRSNGVLDTGYRNFNLINGRCVPKDRFVGKQIVCKRNERIVRHQQPNGWVRIEKQFYVRDGCSCVQKLAVDYDKWNCPPPVMKRRCIQASNEQFILETISTKWELSDSKPICSRLDTVIDRVPIDCSEEYVNKSDKCAFNLGRHALVRIDQVTSFYADGCRCIENNVRQVFTVCKCLRPHQEKSCLHSEGVLIHQNVHYEVSGDKSRCIPRRTRNIFKVTCSPVGPQYKGRTQCDPKTGNFYHLYEESKRVGCQCVKSELRVPARCKCPEPYTQIRCSTNNVQQLNTTTYKLSSKGTCIKSERLHYKFIKCQIPEEILQESPNYEVVQNEYSVRHLHKCGSAGKCSRIIREYKVHTNQRCNCIVQKQQYKEACCCPTEQDLNQFYPGTNSSQPMLFSKQCDADKGLILSNTIKWNLEHGQCWPVVYKTIQPIVCDGKEFLRPVSFCRAGQQKHIHQREIRKGCGCKANKRVVTIPCSCDPLGSTDVVFLVDESMESKQVDYSQYVHKIIKHTVNIFYESSQSANLDELFRFCIVKYSLKTKIVSGLKSYSELYELYAEIKKLTLNNGQQSDLKLALRFLMSRIIPQTRPGASLIIYIITDGARNQLPAAKKLSDYLKTHNVQINVLLLISDRVYDVQFFKQLVSPPSAIHLVELKRNSDQLSRNLSRIADTICKKSCPLNYKKETSCSYGTNCVGRTYTFMYRFDSVKGHCVGKTIVKRKRCCCMQVVQRKRICENNHLIHYTTNWQLTSKGFCKQYITRRDVTGLAISQYSDVITCLFVFYFYLARLAPPNDWLPFGILDTVVNCIV
ncbi:unnamed protein product [Heterobilharzia americana]|nr:unnamed protein product [Heterobilharzia americana]